jgi:hypothetical protein
MNDPAAVHRAIPVLAKYGGGDLGITTAVLLASGLTKAQAHDAVRFIPLALGREVLQGIPIPATVPA